MTEEFEVSSSQASERLDKILSLWNPELSRSFFQKLIKDQQILVNGISRKANYRVEEHDIISVNIPKAQEIEILPQNIPLEILYEDSDLLIVNKPKGMVVHPGNGNPTGTVANAVMAWCKESLSGM